MNHFDPHNVHCRQEPVRNLVLRTAGMGQGEKMPVLETGVEVAAHIWMCGGGGRRTFISIQHCTLDFPASTTQTDALQCTQ